MSINLHMSDKYKPFFQKLSVPGKSQDELSYSFSSEEIEHENGSAHIFGIFSISSSSEIYQFFIRETVKHFHDFYQRVSAISPTHDFSNSTTSEFIFENAIQYVYEKVTLSLSDYKEARERSVRLDIKKIQCILGCYTDGRIYLNSTGSQLHGYYIYPRASKHAPIRYTLIPIIEPTRDDEGSARLFSSMVSGAVAIRQSTIVMCTPSLLDYLSMEQLKQMISTQRGEVLQHSLERMFAKVSSRNDITALFLHPYYDGPLLHTSKSTTASSASMEQLRIRQQGTDSVLKPAIRFSFNKGLLSLWHRICQVSTLFVTIEKRFMQPTTWNRVHRFIIMLYKHVVCISERIIISLKNVRLKSNVVRSHDVSQQKKVLTLPVLMLFVQKKILRIPSFCAMTLGRGKKMFLSLSIPSRSLFILSGLFIILFVTSLFTLQSQNSFKKTDNTINEIITQAQQMSNAVEASILFKNSDETLRLISDLERIMTTLPIARTEAQSQAIQSLRVSIDKLKARAYHITIINEPRLIATLPYADDGTYRIASNGLNAVITNNSQIAHLNLKNGTLTNLTNSDILATLGAIAVSDHMATIASRDGAALFSVGMPGPLELISINRNAVEQNFSVLEHFNDSLYVLDRSSNNIYKHVRSGKGFGVGVPWIVQQSVDLTNALDMDIDGTIYLLNPANQLYRYSRGRPSPVPFPVFQPPLQTVSRIETDPDSKLLFFAEPRGGRIFAINKETFALVTQITSPAFQAISDIALESKSGDLLVMSGSHVYRVESSYFKQ